MGNVVTTFSRWLLGNLNPGPSHIVYKRIGRGGIGGRADIIAWSPRRFESDEKP